MEVAAKAVHKAKDDHPGIGLDGFGLLRSTFDNLKRSQLNGIVDAKKKPYKFIKCYEPYKDKCADCKSEYTILYIIIIITTRSIQRTQTPPRLSPLTCDVDLMTRSRTLKLSKIMLRFDKFCNHSFL